MTGEVIEPGTLVGACPECGPVYGDSIHVTRADVAIDEPTKTKCNLCGSELTLSGLAQKQVEVPEEVAEVNEDG